MNGIHCIGDLNNAGGAILETPNDWVTTDGALDAVDGSIGTSHAPCPNPPIHCEGNWITDTGDVWDTIDGIAVNHQTDIDTCGHVRAATTHGWVTSNT